MAILTLKGHISRALNFFNNYNTLYAAIGKSSEWVQGDCEELKDGVEEGRNYDLNPPFPSINDEFLELIAFKKVESAFMVVQDDDGSLEYRGTKWRIVSGDTPEDTRRNAYREGSRWVYLSTTLNYTEISTTLPYRQVGIFSNVSRTSSEGDPAVLYPDGVVGAYVLEADLRNNLILEYDGTTYRRLKNDTDTPDPGDEGKTVDYIQIKIEYNGTTSEGDKEYLETDTKVYTDGTYGSAPKTNTIYDSIEPVMFVPDATLEILDNRKPVYRDADVREVIKIILEF